MLINIKALNGFKHELEINENTRVKDVKIMLMEKDHLLFIREII